jgi:flagellar biosynthesis GTPase FlhF
VPAPEFEDGKLVFSDFLNLFIFNSKENLGGVVRALSNKGLFQSLAEPNLIATNGKEASFLAGGEYPYPVVQSGSGTNSVTITFKEFGVRLSFTPTVLGGDLIHLKVKPEVSSLDFANAVVIDGFRVPALSTRRTETEVELRDGQTFAIAGLMNNTLTSTLGKIPGIGDIPILGLLFKSKAHQKNQTELVVMITPSIIKKGQMGVSEGLPSLTEPYLPRPDKTYPSPDPYTGSPRYPSDRPLPKEGNGTVPRQGAAQMPEPLKPVTASTTSSTSTPAQKAAPAQSTTTPAPVPSRPISQTAPVTPPAAKPAAVPATSAPAQAAPVTVAPAKTAPAAAAKSTKASTPTPAASKQAAAVKTEVKEVDRAAERAAEKAREQELKAAAAEAKQREAEARQKAEEDKAAQLKAEEDRRQADRLSKERARREAEIARKNAETAKKQADEDAKREKALAEAAARLKAAQTQYQAEVEKSKGGSNEKPKESGKESSGSTTKQ